MKTADLPGNIISTLMHIGLRTENTYTSAYTWSAFLFSFDFQFSCTQLIIHMISILDRNGYTFSPLYAERQRPSPTTAAMLSYHSTNSVQSEIIMTLNLNAQYSAVILMIWSTFVHSKLFLWKDVLQVWVSTSVSQLRLTFSKLMHMHLASKHSGWLLFTNIYVTFYCDSSLLHSFGMLIFISACVQSSCWSRAKHCMLLHWVFWCLWWKQSLDAEVELKKCCSLLLGFRMSHNLSTQNVSGIAGGHTAEPHNRMIAQNHLLDWIVSCKSVIQQNRSSYKWTCCFM